MNAAVNPMKIRSNRIADSSTDWIMNGDEFGAIWECHFYLDLADHFGNALHDSVASQDFGAFGHQVGNGLPITCPLHDKIRYERDAFGVVQLDTSRQPRSSDQCRKRYHQLVLFTWRKIHANLCSKLSMTTSSGPGTGRHQVRDCIAEARHARPSASPMAAVRQSAQ